MALIKPFTVDYVSRCEAEIQNPQPATDARESNPVLGKGITAMRGDGKVFRHPRSKFLWVRYSVRGKLFRESTGEIEWKRAERFLRHRLAEVGADRLGLKKFIGPKHDRVLVKEMLDALEADYRLREVKSLPQVHAHMRPIREVFGHRRAVDVTSDSVGASDHEHVSPLQHHG